MYAIDERPPAALSHTFPLEMGVQRSADHPDTMAGQVATTQSRYHREGTRPPGRHTSDQEHLGSSAPRHPVEAEPGVPSATRRLWPVVQVSFRLLVASPPRGVRRGKQVVGLMQLSGGEVHFAPERLLFDDERETRFEVVT